MPPVLPSSEGSFALAFLDAAFRSCLELLFVLLTAETDLIKTGSFGKSKGLTGAFLGLSWQRRTTTSMIPMLFITSSLMVAFVSAGTVSY